MRTRIGMTVALIASARQVPLFLQEPTCDSYKRGDQPSEDRKPFVGRSGRNRRGGFCELE